MIDNVTSATALPAMYFTFPQALSELRSKFVAVSVEEITAWLFLGDLVAYEDAKELAHPPRFILPAPDEKYSEPLDYGAMLAPCYFLKTDISAFNPLCRYINGAKLLERWSVLSDIHPESFINAKIKESKSNTDPRLLVFHPIYGISSAHLGDDYYPPLHDCLCSVNDIREIETQDFHESQKFPAFFVDSEKFAETSASNLVQVVEEVKWTWAEMDNFSGLDRKTIQTRAGRLGIEFLERPAKKGLPEKGLRESDLRRIINNK